MTKLEETQCSATLALTALVRGNPINVARAQQVGAEGVLISLLDNGAASEQAALAVDGLRALGLKNLAQQEDAVRGVGDQLERGVRVARLDTLHGVWTAEAAPAGRFSGSGVSFGGSSFGGFGGKSAGGEERNMANKASTVSSPSPAAVKGARGKSGEGGSGGAPTADGGERARGKSNEASSRLSPFSKSTPKTFSLTQNTERTDASRWDVPVRCESSSSLVCAI